MSTHFADHIAFLAHNKEGAKYVAAVTIEEDREGQSLTIRVAANLTPSKNVLHSLSGIFQVLESYARKGKFASTIEYHANQPQTCLERNVGKVCLRG